MYLINKIGIILVYSTTNFPISLITNNTISTNIN